MSRFCGLGVCDALPIILSVKFLSSSFCATLQGKNRLFGTSAASAAFFGCRTPLALFGAFDEKESGLDAALLRPTTENVTRPSFGASKGATFFKYKKYILLLALPFDHLE